MGCGYGGLDLAQNFFTQFASADAGIVYGSWNDGGSLTDNALAVSTTNWLTQDGAWTPGYMTLLTHAHAPPFSVHL